MRLPIHNAYSEAAQERTCGQYNAGAPLSRWETRFAKEPRLAVGAATDIYLYVTITRETGEMLVGWFDVPFKLHFMDSFSQGTCGRASRLRARMPVCVPLASLQNAPLWRSG
jgi:hypothetical protein